MSWSLVLDFEHISWNGKDEGEDGRRSFKIPQHSWKSSRTKETWAYILLNWKTQNCANLVKLRSRTWKIKKWQLYDNGSNWINFDKWIDSIYSKTKGGSKTCLNLMRERSYWKSKELGN